jgi:hypothetical protein
MEFTDEMIRRLHVPGKGFPVHHDDRPPQIEDPARIAEDHRWQPACPATYKLIRCLEAVRDVSSSLAVIAATQDPGRDKRLLKPLVISVYNLALAVRDLFNYIQAECGKSFTQREHRELNDAFKAFEKAVPTGKGLLKTVRDKLAAHLDKDAFNQRQLWNSFDIEDVLGWIRGSVKLLAMFLNPDLYSWTRPSGYDNVVNLMNVDGSEVSLRITDGHPDNLVGIRFSTSPKYAIALEIHELVKANSALCQRLGINEGHTWKVPGDVKS